MIVVLDTNVWISAIIGTSTGTPRRALERAILLDTIAICEPIETEILEILHRKFKRDPESTLGQLEVLLFGAIRTTVRGNIHECRDEDDDMVLECAVNAGAHLILSGDKDLLDLKLFQGIRIITARQYIERK